MKNKNLETRQLKTECRAFEKDGKKGIEGYAIIWGQESKILYERGVYFIEKIERGAADKILATPNLDVKYKYNHRVLIARTISGTLKLESNERGLKYIVDDLPNTTDANNLHELAKRGIVFESSFAFMANNDGQNWTTREDGIKLRTISEFSYLDDVSSVDDGAYANTDVAVRSLNEFLKIDKKPDLGLELKRKRIELLKLKG